MGKIPKRYQKIAGFGLVEALIAAALLLVATYAVVSFLTQSQKTSLTLEGSSECVQRVEQVLQGYKKDDNKLRIDNWHPTINQARPVGLANPRRFMFDIVVPPAGGGAVTARDTNTWELIDNATNSLLAFYNSAGAYCSTNPGDLGVQIISPPGQALKDERVYLKILRQNTGTGSKDCSNRGTQKIVPLGGSGNNDPTVMDFGLEINASVTYTDSLNNQTKSCRGAILVKPDADKVAPTFLSSPFPTDVSLPGCPAGRTMCFRAPNLVSGNISCNDRNPVFSFVANEPATVFLCKLDSEQTTTNTGWRSCASGTATLDGANITFSISTTHTIRDGKTGAILNLMNVPEGWFTLNVKAVDSAWNESSEISFRFGIDLSRPATASLNYPNNLISTFKTDNPAWGHLPVDPLYSAATIGGYFQCVDQLDTWTGNSSGEPVSVSRTGVIFSGELGPCAGCSNSCRSRLGLASGNHSASVSSCDQCGGGSGSDTKTWIYDPGPPPTANHTGTVFDHVIPSFGLTPAKGLPYTYVCQNMDGTFSNAVGTCRPGGFTPVPCSQSSVGFCTRAFDGCGRTDADSAQRYRVRSIVGEACKQVDCIAGVICAIDQPSHNGTCVANESCMRNSDCGLPHRCYDATLDCVVNSPPLTGYCDPATDNVGSPCTVAGFTSGPTPSPTNFPGTCQNPVNGTCHGNTAGPSGGVGQPQPPRCPDLVVACGAPTPPCTPGTGCPGMVCIGSGILDACGNPCPAVPCPGSPSPTPSVSASASASASPSPSASKTPSPSPSPSASASASASASPSASASKTPTPTPTPSPSPSPTPACTPFSVELNPGVCKSGAWDCWCQASDPPDGPEYTQCAGAGSSCTVGSCTGTVTCHPPRAGTCGPVCPGPGSAADCYVSCGPDSPQQAAYCRIDVGVTFAAYCEGP